MKTSQENKFYVYSHIRNDSGNIFYIGKGCARRAYQKSGRSELWTRIANKYGYSVKIIKNKMTEKDAFDLEADLIKKTEGLCNLTSGGEGVSGMVHSDEAREKIRKAHAGKKQSKEIIEARTKKLRGKKRTSEFCEDVRKRNLGRKASEETKRKMSEARKGRKPSKESIEKVAAAHRGLKRSDEARARMSAAQQKRSVFCAETSMLFESIKDAESWLRQNGHPKATKGGIWRSMNRTENGTAYGLTWKYADV